MIGRVYKGSKIGSVKPSSMKIGRVCRCKCGGDKMDMMREMMKEKREE